MIRIKKQYQHLLTFQRKEADKQEGQKSVTFLKPQKQTNYAIEAVKHHEIIRLTFLHASYLHNYMSMS